MTGRGCGRGKKQASKASRRKGPPLPVAAPLPHSDDTEEPPSRSGSPVKAKKPPTRSGSPVTAKKLRKDCRITDPGVEDELVEWFRENDSLWNTQRTAYRDKACRQLFLATKAVNWASTAIKGQTNVNVYERSSNACGTIA